MRLVLVQANLFAEISHCEMGAFLAVLGWGDARYVVLITFRMVIHSARRGASLQKNRQ